MGTPQVILLIFTALNLFATAVAHDKPRPNYNFFGYFISIAMWMSLLIWGGFFNKGGLNE